MNKDKINYFKPGDLFISINNLTKEISTEFIESYMNPFMIIVFSY